MQLLYDTDLGQIIYVTLLALMELTEEITTALDDKKVTAGVFIDLKKAFDTINHNLLLKKLAHYGVRGVANKWLASYLSNRKQYVSIDECNSDLLNVLCGVPQGSILGPKLFILYVNYVTLAKYRVRTGHGNP